MYKTVSTIVTGGLTVLSLLALPAPTLAQAGEVDLVPITNPALLESLGFSPDATDVHATQRALRELAMSPAEHEAAQDATARLESSSLFGTNSWGYTPIAYRDFRPIFSSGQYVQDLDSLYCISSTTAVYEAPLRGLPHGARLRFVHLWLYDSSSEDISAILVRQCQPDFTAGAPASTVLAGTSTSGATGHQLRTLGFCFPPCSGIDEVIDLQSCSYFVRVWLDDDVTCSAGPSLRIQKARAQWVRQVSPPPSTATFDDVPTGHQFFQHIEALAASGITGGCDDDSYCPNAPLTRGQMAAFLAKALGLHWDIVGQP